MPSSSRTRVSSAVVLVAEQPLGERLGLVLRQALGLVDQDQLLLLLLGRLLELGRLGVDLPLVELARAVDRQPLAHGHRAGAGDQTGDAGEQDGVRRRRGAGDPHHQAEVGDQAVVGAEHRGAQRVAAGAAMAPLEHGDVGAGEARGLSTPPPR